MSNICCHVVSLEILTFVGVDVMARSGAELYRKVCDDLRSTRNILEAKATTLDKRTGAFATEAADVAAKFSGPISEYRVRQGAVDPQTGQAHLEPTNIDDDMIEFGKRLTAAEAEFTRLWEEHGVARAETEAAVVDILGGNGDSQEPVLVREAKAEMASEFGGCQRELEELAKETVASLTQSENVSGPLRAGCGAWMLTPC